MVFRPELLVVAIILIIVGLIIMNVHIAMTGASVVYWLGVAIVVAGAALFLYWLYKFALGTAGKGT